MNKNDRLIAILGVIILIVSSIGIYMWTPTDTTNASAEIGEIIETQGQLKNVPTAIAVSDNDPFYALIATPLAVHYDAEGTKEVLPLYIEDFDDPSDAILDVQDSINYPINCELTDDMDAKNWSLEIAETYWEYAETALIIQYNQTGYELGLIATPIASYLSIPVIVTDVIDTEVTNVLSTLGVTKSIVCGNLTGYGDTAHYDDLDTIITDVTHATMEYFGSIDYIAMANPIDAFPPEVLKSKTFYMGKDEIKSGTFTNPTQIGAMAPSVIDDSWTFTIPADYKYALIKFEGINHDIDNVETMGDSAAFYIGPDLEDIPAALQSYEILVSTTANGGIPDRDSTGRIINDKIYAEAVVYDRGGVTYNVKTTGAWLAQSSGSVSAIVTVEKLASPQYALMHGLSMNAPYLAAYHQGIVFAKPDFIFTADDDVITEKGTTSPGLYVPRRNPDLTDNSNDHFVENIHEPLNALLSDIADIEVSNDADLEYLRDYYVQKPLNIALVGGATVLPHYVYQNSMEPADYEDAPYYFGGGTPSDNLYGNIDPIEGWDPITNDLYSTYPYQENVVSRVTGWDAQDTSALIARTVFYNRIIEDLGDWKDNYALLIGGGQDFQKPFISYRIFGDLLQLTPHGEPMKIDTGYGEMLSIRTEALIAEPMGFNVYSAFAEEAMLEGWDDDSLTAVKKSNLIMSLILNKRALSNLIGEEVVYGGEYMEQSNFIWANAHGQMHMFGMAGTELTATGWFGPLFTGALKELVPLVQGGFAGPGAHFSTQGDYGTRNVEGMDFGPSFMWLESCFCGKIDGVSPTTSISQTLLHSGVTGLIASSTGSNIGGGYLEPKNRLYDNPLSVWKAKRATFNAMDNGEYPDEHFGYLIYTDMCTELEENNVSLGQAFLTAKNKYLEQDADWVLWWAPPLVQAGLLSENLDAYDRYLDIFDQTASGSKSTMLENKYVSYYEYILYGDPCFNPYEPHNEGLD